MKRIVKNFVFMAGGDHRCRIDLPIAIDGKIEKIFIPYDHELKDSRIEVEMDNRVVLAGSFVALSGIDFYYEQKASRGLFSIGVPEKDVKHMVAINFSGLPSVKVFDLSVVYSG